MGFELLPETLNAIDVYVTDWAKGSGETMQRERITESDGVNEGSLRIG